MDEFELIARYFAPLAASEPGALGLADDAAVLSVDAGRRLVITTDSLVAGVHYRPGDDPGDIAAKLLRVNLSDLAAMGAKPMAYTLAAALPAGGREGFDAAWLGRFAESLAREQALWEIVLVGGDTVATPGPTTLTLTAFGTVAVGGELKRSLARDGDTVHVSGTIGDAALGLLALEGALPGLAPDLAAALGRRYHRPEPRVGLGLGLSRLRLEGSVNAVIDISDGLMSDLGHICSASGTGAVVETASIPLSEAARAVVESDPARIVTVLAGGDDYELLITAPDGSREALARLSGDCGVALTAIGRVVADPAAGVRALDGKGGEVGRGGGYRHFR